MVRTVGIVGASAAFVILRTKPGGARRRHDRNQVTVATRTTTKSTDALRTGTTHQATFDLPARGDPSVAVYTSAMPDITRAGLFIGASLALLMTPGPAVLYIV